MRALLVVCCFSCWTANISAQSPTEKSISDLLDNGSFRLYTKQVDTIRELANRIAFLPTMAWYPGRDLRGKSSAELQISSSYTLVKEGGAIFLVLMVPDNMTNINIKLSQVDEKGLKGEWMMPEFMFYDPQHPPKLPPPTFVYLERENTAASPSFTQQNMVGVWTVQKVEGCEFSLPYSFTVKSDGVATESPNGNEFEYKISPAGHYIMLSPGEFSQRIIGRHMGEGLIEGFSEVTRCRFEFKKK